MTRPWHEQLLDPDQDVRYAAVLHAILDGAPTPPGEWNRRRGYPDR